MSLISVVVVGWCCCNTCQPGRRCITFSPISRVPYSPTPPYSMYSGMIVRSRLDQPCCSVFLLDGSHIITMVLFADGNWPSFRDVLPVLLVTAVLLGQFWSHMTFMTHSWFHLILIIFRLLIHSLDGATHQSALDTVCAFDQWTSFWRETTYKLKLR